MTLKKLLILLAWIGSIVGAVVSGTILSKAQSYLVLQYEKTDKTGYHFKFKAIGNAPVIVNDIQTLDGQISARTTRAFTTDSKEFKELTGKPYVDIQGQLVTGAIKNITLFPQEELPFIYSLKYPYDFVEQHALTMGIKYDHTYDENLLNYLFSATDFIGVTRSERAKCFFLCGNSGSAISCTYLDENVVEMSLIIESFCNGEFKSDSSCCK